MSDPYRDADIVEKRHVVVIDVGTEKLQVYTLPDSQGINSRTYTIEINGSASYDIGELCRNRVEKRYEPLPDRRSFYRSCIKDAKVAFKEFLNDAHATGFLIVPKCKDVIPMHRIMLIQHERVQNLMTFAVPGGYEFDESQENT